MAVRLTFCPEGPAGVLVSTVVVAIGVVDAPGWRIRRTLTTLGKMLCMSYSLSS